jgi:hypothetical protein
MAGFEHELQSFIVPSSIWGQLIADMDLIMRPREESSTLAESKIGIKMMVVAWNRPVLLYDELTSDHHRRRHDRRRVGFS